MAVSHYKPADILAGWVWGELVLMPPPGLYSKDRSAPGKTVTPAHTLFGEVTCVMPTLGTSIPLSTLRTTRSLGDH